MATTHVVLVWSEQAEDEPWLQRARQQLATLAHAGELHLWDTRDIEPGATRASVYRAALEAAAIVVVLVSAALLADAALVDEVLGPLVERAHAGAVGLIPAHIHPTVAEEARLGPQRIALTAFKGVATPDKPLSSLSWSDAERRLADLAGHVAARLEPMPARAIPDGTPLPTSRQEIAHMSARDPRALARLTVEFTRQGDTLSVTYSQPGLGELARDERPWPRAADAILNTLDAASPSRFAAQLPEWERRWGAELFEVLFGADEGLWQRVLRRVYDIAPEQRDPTPMRGGVAVRIVTREATLAALPWRLTRWKDWRLVENEWAFMVARAHGQPGAVSTSVHAGFCVLAPEAAPESTTPRARAALDKLRQRLQHVWQPAPDGAWREARTRAGLVAALKGQRSHVLLIHAHALPAAEDVAILVDRREPERGRLVELLDGPHPKPERLRLADIEACWHEAGHRPDLVILWLHLHGDAAARLRRALASCWSDVPLVVAPALSDPDPQDDGFLSEWMGAWLQKTHGPLEALASLPPARASAATAWGWARYDDWHTAPRREKPVRPLHLQFDRRKPKAIVVGMVQDLADAQEKRVLALIGHGTPDDGVELLSEQLTEHLADRARHATTITPLRLHYAFDLAPLTVASFREHLRIALNAHGDEPDEHLLRRHAPGSAPVTRKPVLWLDWGLLSNITLVEPWALHSARLLRRSCPAEIRVVSFAALTVAAAGHMHLAEQLRAAKRQLDSAIMVHRVDLDAFDADDIYDCLITIGCPSDIADTLAAQIDAACAGVYRRAVELLARGQATDWYALLDELEAQVR